GELAFATRNRNAERSFYRAVALQVLWRHRFLEPADAVLLDHAAEPDGGDGIEGVIGVDHQRDVGPDRLTHGARHLGVLVDAESDLELHGLETIGHITRGLFREVAQRVAGLAAVEP